MILAVITMAQILTAFSHQSLPPLAPFYQDDLGLSRAQVGFLYSSFFIGGGATFIIGGWLADLLGVKRLLIAGLVVMGFFLIGVSRAPVFAVAVLFVTLTAVGSGMNNPATVKAITIWFPARIRGTAMGIKQTGNPIGGIIAATLLPSLALAVGWRNTLALAGLVIATSSILCQILYRETPEEAPPMHRPLGSKPGMKRFREVLANRDILLLSSACSILLIGQTSLIGYLVLFSKEVLAMPVVSAGWLLALAQVGATVGRISWGLVSDRLFGGKRKPVLILTALLSAAMAALMGQVTQSTTLLVLVPMIFLFGASAVGWNAIFLVYVAELSATETIATAVGLAITVINIGSIVGPPIFGYIIDTTGSYSMAWRLVALITALVFVLLPAVRERPKEF